MIYIFFSNPVYQGLVYAALTTPSLLSIKQPLQWFFLQDEALGLD